MERLEVDHNVPHSIWLYLPTELWFQIFQWLRATRYIALIGALSKGFREFMIEYFKSVGPWMNKNMNVAIVGAPAVGKTTMLAHLFLQSRLNNIEHRFANFMAKNNKLPVTSHYNSFLNARNAKHPITYTQHIRPFYFDTSLHHFTFFDSPGCARRLITAYRICSQVNTAILVLQRKQELDLDWLISGVTAVWTSLTHSHFIIAVNYSHGIFTQPNWEADQKLLYEKLVKAVPAKLLANIKLIPINALEGFNIYSPHAGIDDSNIWYNGPTLYRALHAIWEKLEYPAERIEKPFSMTVLRPMKVGGVGPIIAGAVNSGCLKPGMKLRVCCSGFPATPLVVHSIQHNGRNMDEAKPSDYIGISFTSASRTQITGWNILEKVKYGMIVADNNNPPKRVKSFTAAIAITSSRAGQLREGQQYKAIYQGNHIFVVFKTFVQVLDKDHKEVTRKNLHPGDSCLALCIPTQEMWTYPKTNNRNQKKDGRDVILFTTQRRISAVGRIDAITFFEDNEVAQQPKQFAHGRQPEIK